MKIIYYSPHPFLSLNSASGYGTHMREMIAMFEELGHEVLPVIAGPDQDPVKQSTQSASTSIKSIVKNFIPAIFWQSLKDINLIRFDKGMEQVLREKIKSFKPDFVYERINYLQSSGPKVCSEMGVCHFSEINSPYVKEKVELEGKTLMTSKAINTEKYQLETSSKVFAVSNVLAEYFVKTHNLKGKAAEIAVVPNAINLKKFQPDNEKVNQLKKEFSIEEAEIIVGFVGSIFTWHGVDILVDAFNNISEEFDNVRLLIVGDGDSLEDLKMKASNHNISDKVIFTGKKSPDVIPNYMELMDITVMANSNWYGSPIKIFEYAALKKAIIAPDFGPLRDVMETNEHGILIDPSVDNLTEAIKKLLTDNTLRQQVAMAFYKKVVEEHTWKHNAETVLVDYSKYLAENN